MKPLALSFGKRKVGTSKSRAITIKNQGDEALVGSVGDAAVPFAVVEGAGDYVLEPRAKLKIRVEFTADMAGPASGSLEITTNDPSQPLVTIPLGGAGK